MTSGRTERAAALVCALVSLLAGAALLTACSETPSRKPQAQPSASASSSAAAAPLIEAQWRGAPLPFLSALSFSRGGRALHVTLSTHPLTCQQLRKGVQMHADEIAFDLTFAPLLQPDGSEIWAISRVRFGKVTRQGKLGKVTLNTESPLESLRAQIDLSVTFPPHRLELAGAITTSACGVLPSSIPAPRRKQEQLQIELAGKPWVIRGASLVQHGGKRRLRLSSQAHSCGSHIGSDLAIVLTLAPDGHSVEQVRADGYVLTTTLSGRPEPGTVKVSGLSAEMPAKGNVQLDIDGQLALGSYRLSLLGTANAEICESEAER